MPWLISATQLDKFRKSQNNLIIFDASWHMPTSGRDAKREFQEKHIEDAYFFDIDQFSDPNTSLPHMLIQDERVISEKLSAMGVRNDCKIIFYDNSDLHTSCRALWMLKVFGHHTDQLYILDGGLKAWEKFGGKVDAGDSQPSPKTYTVNFQRNLIRDLAQMKENFNHPKEQVVDLRHAVRFAGGAEPRPGLRVGHMPRSYSFPYHVFFDKEGYFLSPDAIRKRMIDVSIHPGHAIITTCGSGMTAPIMNFMLDLLGNHHNAVYDGSWTEWGAETLYLGERSLDERPVETCVE